MHYIVCGSAAAPEMAAEGAGASVLAAGEPLVLEGPWPLGRTALAFAREAPEPASFVAAAPNGLGAYAVEGFAEPGPGHAFVIAAHRMLDPEGFRPYAEAIPSLLARYGVRSLARGGRVTSLAGDFFPDRGVVLEFPTVEAVVDFYMSETYAPLLALRRKTTDPRFAVLSRVGPIPPAAQRAAETYLSPGRG